jgi:hypothetical protein
VVIGAAICTVPLDLKERVEGKYCVDLGESDNILGLQTSILM